MISCLLLSMCSLMLYYAIHALLGALAEVIPKRRVDSEKSYITN